MSDPITAQEAKVPRRGFYAIPDALIDYSPTSSATKTVAHKHLRQLKDDLKPVGHAVVDVQPLPGPVKKLGHQFVTMW